MKAGPAARSLGESKTTRESMIIQTEVAAKKQQNLTCLLQEKEMRKDLADKAEIHAIQGAGGSFIWLAGQTRPEMSCQVFQLQQNLPQLRVPQLGASSMVVRRVQQHSDLGLKIRRVSMKNMTVLLQVDDSLNADGLVGSQGGYTCGVTDQSLQEGKKRSMDPTRVAFIQEESHSAMLVRG